MFFRIKPSGERRYLQIVENTRDGASTRQRVLATLGRVEDLEADGRLSLPICAQKPLRPACRAPVSSTVIQEASAVPSVTRHAFDQETVLAIDQPYHLG